MTTTKSASTSKPVQAAAEFALVQFPAGKLKTAFNKMAKQATSADDASELKAIAAFDVCELAEHFRNVNLEAGADVDTIAKGWSAHLKTVALDLAVSGNRFAELKEGKDGAAATAKLTAYGANVASVAKGLIQENVNLMSLPEGVEGLETGQAAESYRDVRKVVEALRAARRRSDDPEAALLADAKEACRAAADELLKTVFADGDYDLIDNCRDMLESAHKHVQSELAKQAQIEADKIAAETTEVAEAA